MKIFIICSKHFYHRIPEIELELKKLGHEVTMPNSYEEPFKEERMKELGSEEHSKWKREMMKLHEPKIKANDVILVLNFEKNGQSNYIGGGTFMEVVKAWELEKKILEVARLLNQHHLIEIINTFLGAHALPLEFKNRSDDYIDLVCNEMLNTLVEHDLVDAVDVFCEDIGFSYAQTQRVFNAAKKLGLAIKCHAEQLSNQQGAALVAQYNGLSADHLEYLDETGVKAMANAGTVAVLLPGAFYFLKETKYPPIELLNKYKVPIAIATDFNPGTSPLCSLQLMMNMACTLFNFTPEQALMGVTAHGARALGFTDRGVLKVGARADIAHWQIEHPAQLSYQFGVNKLLNLWILGKLS